jgi:hypothetical protein
MIQPDALSMGSMDIVIAPPVRGHWVIYNPPGHPVLAFDLLAEDDNRSLYNEGNFLKHLISFISVEHTFTWSRPVFSPVDGIVVASHDAEDDRRRISFIYDLFSMLLHRPKITDGFGAFGGNHIMIRADDYHVLLCHLKKGSVRVKENDAVRVGQQIAEVGNSGSSIQPHLHIQVMNNDQYFPLFENLLPFRFKGGQVEESGEWLSQSNIEPRNRMHFLFGSAPE